MKCRSAAGFVGSVAWVALFSLVACAPASEEETETTEAELVRFPAGIFPSATRMSYGQTLPAVAFKTSALFAAVRFRASRGDRVTGTVDAGAKKAIVYLVRKQGATYVNVKAGGQGVDTTSNVVSFTIEATDDYYLAFRTIPRTDTSFAVKLEASAASQACPDAGRSLSVNELVASVPSGAGARREGPRMVAHVERRECTYATGCGPVTASFDRELPHLFYALQAYGNQQWRVVDGVTPSTEPTANRDQVSFRQGQVTGTIAGLASGAPAISVRGTAGPTCFSLEESHSKDRDNGVSYIDYRVVAKSVTDPLESFSHGAAQPLPKVPVIDTLSDEEALRQFPRGSNRLIFAKNRFEDGRLDGFQRNCAPLTSCSPPQRGGSACRKLGFDVRVTKAEVTGRDAYRLSTSLGFVDIVDGAGTVVIDRKPVTLRVNEDTLQFEFPASSTPADANGLFQEFSNSTCTFPFSWTAM